MSVQQKGAPILQERQGTGDVGYSRERAWEYENGFYLTSDPSRIGKLLAQFEIYKLITDLPGEVLELGVFKASSLVRLLTFRELLENQYSRRVIGFDSFGQFPPQADALDSAFIRDWEAEAGAALSREDVAAYLESKRFSNYELVVGDVTETAPAYLDANPHARIALLHLDLDVYAPTREMIDLLYTRLVPGAVVMIDDYSRASGATRAIDEFLTENPHTLKKPSLAHIPAYFVKHA